MQASFRLLWRFWNILCLLHSVYVYADAAPRARQRFRILGPSSDSNTQHGDEGEVLDLDATCDLSPSCMTVFVNGQIRKGLPSGMNISLLDTYEERITSLPLNFKTLSSVVSTAFRTFYNSPLIGFDAADDDDTSSLHTHEEPGLHSTHKAYWWTGAHLMRQCKSFMTALQLAGDGYNPKEMIIYGKGFGVPYELAFWSSVMAGLAHIPVADYFEVSDVLSAVDAATRPALLVSTDRGRLAELAASVPSTVPVLVFGTSSREDWWPAHWNLLEDNVHTKEAPPSTGTASLSEVTENLVEPAEDALGFNQYVSRLNASGQAMLISMGTTEPALLQMCNPTNCLGDQPNEVKMSSFPLFSPDAVFLICETLCGRSRFVGRAPLSHLTTYTKISRGATLQFSNPPQVENWYQDFLYARNWQGQQAWLRNFQPSIRTHDYHIGGGALSSAQVAWLHGGGHGLLANESFSGFHVHFEWGSADCGVIGHDGFLDKEDGYLWYPPMKGIVSYRVKDYGPYKRSSKQGQLLIGGSFFEDSKHYDGRAWKTMKTESRKQGSFTPTNTIIEMKVYDGQKVMRPLDKVGHLQSVNVTTDTGVITQPVRTGMLERLIEKSPLIELAFLCTDTDGRLLVHIRPSRHLAVREEDIRRSVQDILESNNLQPWERELRVELASEPWEASPRNKVIQQLRRDPFSPPKRFDVMFDRSLERLQLAKSAPILLRSWPVEVKHLRTQQSSGVGTQLLRSGNRGFLLNVLWTHRVRGAFGRVVPLCRLYQSEDALLCVSQTLTEVADDEKQGSFDAVTSWMVDALLGCYSYNAEAVCLLRDERGGLREPYDRQLAYDPSSNLSSRLRRLDEVPWHLWDLQEVDASATGPPPTHEDIRRELRNHQWADSALRHLPDVIPSLGLLHQFGLRVQRRLEIAQAIARDHPDWLARPMSEELFANVMGYVYHWFPSASRGRAVRAKEPAKELSFVAISKAQFHIDADGAHHTA